MFTGIVQAVGRIERSVPRGDGVRLTVAAGDLELADVALGDSVAISGCCLTVVEIGSGTLGFDVSAETLRCTAGLDREGAVNLEKSLRLADRLGGHIVLGHVDGAAVVTAVAPVAGDSGGSVRLVVAAPAALAPFIAPKGSIAVDGVSLTVNEVEGGRFAVNLIPHTLAVTTLRHLAPGDRVNIEVDVVARYVARLHAFEAGGAPAERER
jgi:riboflavin synthase